MKKEKNQSRRSFIKKGLAGLAGATILPSVLKADKKTQSNEEKPKRKFIYRTLGKTGLNLPIVSMGTTHVSETALVNAALDAGIVLIDTAQNYVRGRSEIIIGKAVKGRPRDSYVIATKVWPRQDSKTGLISKVTEGSYIEKFEESLKRLGMEYVDILYVHDVVRSESAVFQPVLNALEKLKRGGKARFVGISTHRNEPEIIRAAVESKVYDVILTAYNFRQPHREEVKKAISYAAKSGIGIVAMKTMAGVYWDRERERPINAKAALKWVLQDENVNTTIPGFSNFEEIEMSLSVMEDLALTPEEKVDLRLGDTLALTGLYCQQCAKCLTQCPGNLDIPTLMRSYMYAYGYKSPSLAKETLESMDLSHLPCQSCDTCQVNCSMGFDVRDKIMDIARIKAVPKDFLA